MGEIRIRIRDRDDALVTALRARAKRNGRPVAAEVRDMLAAAAAADADRRADAVAELRRLHSAMRAAHGELPDSAPGIRAERDDHG